VAASAGERRSRFARFLAHPLTITVAGAVFAAIVLPLVTREWQDRQNELQLKRSLVEQMAEGTTTAVRRGISHVEQQIHIAPPGPTVDISGTYQNWLVRRAITRAVIATYFPSLEACWYDYSNAITTLLELATNRKAAASTRGISNILITSDQECGWSAQLSEAQTARLNRLRERLLRNGLLYPQIRKKPPVVTNTTLQRNYSDLGELLLIGKDGIVGQIVGTPARGYYHGIF
jgi:hypothetical protein